MARRGGDSRKPFVDERYDAESVHTEDDAVANDAAPAAKQEPEAKGGLGNFFRILGMSDTLDRVMMGICSISALGSGIAMPLMFLVFGRIVGDFADYFKPQSDPAAAKAKFMKLLDKNTMYMLYLGIARFVLSYISMLSIRISGLRISARLRHAYLAKLLALPVHAIDTTSPGVVAARLTGNINTIESGISQQFSLAIQAIAFTVGLYVVAFIKSALLTLVASVAIPIVIVAWGFCMPFSNKYYYAAEVIKERASSLAFEMFSSIRVVVAFGAEKRLSAKHDKLLLEAKKIDKKQGPIMGIMMSSMFLAVYAVYALAIWFGIKQYMAKKIDGINTIVVVLFSVLWAVMTFGRLYSPLIRITRAASQATDILAVLDAPAPETGGWKAPLVSSSSDIELRYVTFAYPSRPNMTILDRLSIRFEARKTTAVIGQSGSGKSTIVGLLEKWYAPVKGMEMRSLHDSHWGNLDAHFGNRDSHRGGRDSFKPNLDTYWEDQEDPEKAFAETMRGFMVQSGIFVGGTELGSIDTKWWRSQVGLVQQEPFLFNDTVLENVAYGLAGTPYEEATQTEKLILAQRACREAFAEEFILKLPDGYNTVVGEGGSRLSGGQRQRIAIARAIVKQPPILILDEATSAIDVRSERIVQQALDRASASRTTIVIAHRLSTIKKADKIVVLSKGKVVEQGTHQELLTLEDGMYKRFVSAQNVADMTKRMSMDLSQMYGDEPKMEDGAVYRKPDDESADEVIIKGGAASFFTVLWEQRKHFALYQCVILGAMGGAATYPVQAYIFAKVVEVFTMMRSQLESKGFFWAKMFAYQAIVTGFAFLALGWSAAIIAQHVAAQYRQEYLQNLLKRPIAFFDNDENSAGGLTAMISTDVSQIQQLLGGELGMAMVAVLSLVGSVIIAFIFGWKMSLVGVLALMPVVLIAGYFRVHLEASFEKMNAEVFESSSQFGAEAIAGFRTVTALIMEDVIGRRFAHLLEDHVSKAIGKAKWSTFVFAFSDSADLFCQALCFWYGGRLLGNGEYGIVAFFVVYMAVIQSSMAAGMWFSFSPNMVEATKAAGRMLSMRPSPRSLQRKGRTTLLGGGPAALTFSNVWFTYAGRETPVIKGINIDIHPGQFVAFVGASGSGKSTLINLIERFYDVDYGYVLFDDMDIQSFEPASYRQSLSLVAQESCLYDGTIRENIALSLPEGEATDDAVQRACRAAQIHDFIMSLPDGYNTSIGGKGTQLSGGQRQRLSLARALLRRPSILLLDEATANLDSESERLVQQAIENLAGNGQMTIISVAHRLATIQKADMIFVMGDGRVLEQGNHRHLLTKRGVYYNMCQAQALDR